MFRLFKQMEMIKECRLGFPYRLAPTTGKTPSWLLCLEKMATLSPKLRLGVKYILVFNLMDLEVFFTSNIKMYKRTPSGPYGRISV